MANDASFFQSSFPLAMDCKNDLDFHKLFMYISSTESRLFLVARRCQDNNVNPAQGQNFEGKLSNSIIIRKNKNKTISQMILYAC